MAIGKLYFSDAGYKWGDHDSVLLTDRNYNKIKQHATVYDCRTTLHDLSSVEIAEAIDLANTVEIVNISSDFICEKLLDLDSVDFFGYGVIFNKLTKVRDKVINFEWMADINFETMTGASPVRPTKAPVLWVAGCSGTMGAGVEKTERYGAIVADQLGVPEINLASGGGSNSLAVSRIMLADIKKNDYVILGITTLGRVDVGSKWGLTSYAQHSYNAVDAKKKYYKEMFFNSPTQIAMQMRSILQLDNFCKKIGAKLCVVNLCDVTWSSVLLHDLDSFCEASGDWKITKFGVRGVDLGTDNLHPGPKQHKIWADLIYNFMKEKYHG